MGVRYRLRIVRAEVNLVVKNINLTSKVIRAQIITKTLICNRKRIFQQSSAAKIIFSDQSNCSSCSANKKYYKTV